MEVVDTVSTFFFELYPLCLPPLGDLRNSSFLSFNDAGLKLVIELAISDGCIEVSFGINRDGMQGVLGVEFDGRGE